MTATRLAIATSCLASALLTACVAREATAPARASASTRPVVVQGAMDVEVRKLASSLDHPEQERVKGWTFWRGTIDGSPVVVSKTLKGLSNAAAATVLAAERYEPIAIINQGTAGGHEPDLHVFDIVLGTDAVNLGSFKTGYRDRGRGSAFEEWLPLDLMRSDGSAGNDPNARVMRRFHADEGLLAAARRVRDHYHRGRVVDGVIGSSEVWNSELDRVQQFHDRFGTAAEEMETASAAQIAGLFDIPFRGIRVVANTITNGGASDIIIALAALREGLLDVVKAYVGDERKRTAASK